MPSTSEADVVRNHLVAPSALVLNLSLPAGRNSDGRYHASECGQDAWVHQALRGLHERHTGDLFVVESGAYDGQTASNSLWLERALNFSCLLVEANPLLSAVIAEKHRRCHVLHGGLSINKSIGSRVPFALAGQTGGFVTHLNRWHRARLQTDSSGDVVRFGNGSVAHVPTFPIALVLRALGRRTIDYWSLDTEGSEAEILDASLDDIEVGVASVEWYSPSDRARGLRREQIMASLTRRGFVRVNAAAGGKDDYYVNKGYFERRGVAPPLETPPVGCTSTSCFHEWRKAALDEARGDLTRMRRAFPSVPLDATVTYGGERVGRDSLSSS